ncbi:universal stress protein [Thiohalophilus sp.]|uniref:universal stress protein n=1 Tax=Thiohalophilus sp. TaxID=3028392 RepID=UPI002ACD6574|nr:universal stress protein [Thiohalophilus sp.]MDZ7663585.1 universal stress protein [Thiohalophilus sp.]
MADMDSPIAGFETLLLATDGTEYSAGAESAALDMAAKCGARLLAVRVVLTNPEYEALAPERVEKDALAAREALDELVSRAQANGVECEGIIRHGADPYMEVADLAGERNADMMVIGRRTQSDLTRLMVGDSTARVIGHAPCHVFVVPRAAQMPARGIVAGTDGSERGNAAALAAGYLARTCQLPLYVVSATLPGHSEARRAEAKTAVQQLGDRLKAQSIEAVCSVVEGRPEDVIVDAATKHGADLIVVGSHGRTGLARLLMGSVAERVIGHASCAVLVIK